MTRATQEFLKSHGTWCDEHPSPTSSLSSPFSMRSQELVLCLANWGAPRNIGHICLRGFLPGRKFSKYDRKTWCHFWIPFVWPCSAPVHYLSAHSRAVTHKVQTRSLSLESWDAQASIMFCSHAPWRITSQKTKKPHVFSASFHPLSSLPFATCLSK